MPGNIVWTTDKKDEVIKLFSLNHKKMKRIIKKKN
jgi:hypothetical protein